MEDKKKEVFAYLNGSETDVADFSRKVDTGGFLRNAVLSHLRVSFGLQSDEATKMLNEWLHDYEP